MLKLTPYPRASSGSKSAAARIGDTLSLAGATELAERIQAHWHGHPVGVRVEPIQKVDGACIGYCVRSNLVNGLPPR